MVRIKKPEKVIIPSIGAVKFRRRSVGVREGQSKFGKIFEVYRKRKAIEYERRLKEEGFPVSESLLKDRALIKGKVYYLSEGKNLKDLFPNLSARNKVKVIFDSARELARLHNKGYFHNDLHVENIVIDPNTLKIRFIDFDPVSKKEIRENGLTHYYTFDLQAFCYTFLANRNIPNTIKRSHTFYVNLFLRSYFKYSNIDQETKRRINKELLSFLYD